MTQPSTMSPDCTKTSMIGVAVSVARYQTSLPPTSS